MKKETSKKPVLTNEEKQKIEEEEKLRAKIRNKEEKQKQSKKTMTGCLALILIPVFFIIIAVVLFSGGSEKDRASPTEPVAQQELLELLSFRCYTEYSYFHITGEVKNISNKSLESVVAVGSAYTEDGEFVKSDEVLIEYNPILPNQISPFEVLMTGNPAIKKCKIGFKEFWGSSIPTKTK